MGVGRGPINTGTVTTRAFLSSFPSAGDEISRGAFETDSTCWQWLKIQKYRSNGLLAALVWHHSVEAVSNSKQTSCLILLNTGVRGVPALFSIRGVCRLSWHFDIYSHNLICLPVSFLIQQSLLMNHCWEASFGTYITFIVPFIPWVIFSKMVPLFFPIYRWGNRGLERQEDPTISSGECTTKQFLNHCLNLVLESATPSC